MTKKEIRKIYREKRQQIDGASFERWSDLMLIQFQQLKLDIPDVVMTYNPMESRNEFDARYIVNFCAFKNPALQVVYPVINEVENELMAVSTTTDVAFIENKYGIEEPVGGEIIAANNIEMVLVPLLAFNELGYRVGYGKGYYDRFFSHCNSNIIKVGFSFFDEPVSVDDFDEHDVPLTHCVTPNNLFTF